MTVLVIPSKQPSSPTAPPPVTTVPQVFIPITGTSGGGIPVAIGQFIPPNGLAGFAQQTPAVQSLYRRRGGGGGTRRRKKKAAGAVKRRAKRAGKRAAKKFVKGSAAAKRYMAKIRKMRKR